MPESLFALEIRLRLQIQEEEHRLRTQVFERSVKDRYKALAKFRVQHQLTSGKLERLKRALERVLAIRRSK